MALGARIKQVREDLGWDQAALCAKVPGLSQQNLSNLETRDSKTSEFAVRIADALQVSLRWLLDGAGPRESLEWPLPRVDRSRWDACTDDDRAYIQGAINAALSQCEAARRASGEFGPPSTSDKPRRAVA